MMEISIQIYIKIPYEKRRRRGGKERKKNTIHIKEGERVSDKE
jgi:hypothetical protein